MKKKLLTLLLSFVMVVTIMPAMASISFAGQANTTVPVELVKANTSGSRAIKLSWTKVAGATKYVVYGQKCGKKFKQLAATSENSYVVKKINGKKLKSHSVYKFYVVAQTPNGKVKSKSIHFITGKTKGKYANARSISLKSSKVTIKPGKTATLKVTTKIYRNKKHIKKNHGAATRFIVDNPTVVKVSDKGVVTAKKEGIATIYVQDIGGLWTKAVVTVKPAKRVYTVSFVKHLVDEDTPLPELTARVEEGNKVSKPSTDPEGGAGFVGWFLDKEGINQYDFSQPVTSDLVLYATFFE